MPDKCPKQKVPKPLALLTSETDGGLETAFNPAHCP